MKEESNMKSTNCDCRSRDLLRHLVEMNEFVVRDTCESQIVEAPAGIIN